MLLKKSMNESVLYAVRCRFWKSNPSCVFPLPVKTSNKSFAIPIPATIIFNKRIAYAHVFIFLFIDYFSFLNVHNLLITKFSGIVTSRLTMGAMDLLTLKNATSIQSSTLDKIDVPP